MRIGYISSLSLMALSIFSLFICRSVCSPNDCVENSLAPHKVVERFFSPISPTLSRFQMSRGFFFSVATDWKPSQMSMGRQADEFRCHYFYVFFIHLFLTCQFSCLGF